MSIGSLFHRVRSSPFLRFCLVGGFAAFVNISARVLLSQVMPFQYAVVVAYPFGMTTAYVLSRAFVFERTGVHFSVEYIRFFLVNVVALVQIWLVSMGLEFWFLPAIDWSWHSELVAHTVGVLSPVVTSYYGHKFFTFRRR